MVPVCVLFSRHKLLSRVDPDTLTAMFAVVDAASMLAVEFNVSVCLMVLLVAFSSPLTMPVPDSVVLLIMQLPLVVMLLIVALVAVR